MLWNKIGPPNYFDISIFCKLTSVLSLESDDISLPKKESFLNREMALETFFSNKASRKGSQSFSKLIDLIPSSLKVSSPFPTFKETLFNESYKKIFCWRRPISSHISFFIFWFGLNLWFYFRGNYPEQFRNFLFTNQKSVFCFVRFLSFISIYIRDHFKNLLR